MPMANVDTSTITPTSTDLAAPAPPTARGGSEQLRAIVVGVFLIAAFWPTLVSMYGSWFDEFAYMEHGILVIPAAAYMVWTNRRYLSSIPRSPSAWSIVLLLWGALQATLGLAAHWIWVSRIAFLISLAGCILAVFGVRMLRALAYPLCTLLLMIAPP